MSSLKKCSKGFLGCWEKRSFFQAFSKLVNHRGPSTESHECAQNKRLLCPVVCKISCRQTPGASCTKTCMDFLLKHGVRSNPENVVRTKISRCMNLCACMNPSTFPLCIPINVELSAHVGVPNPSLSTQIIR